MKYLISAASAIAAFAIIPTLASAAGTIIVTPTTNAAITIYASVGSSTTDTVFTATSMAAASSSMMSASSTDMSTTTTATTTATTTNSLNSNLTNYIQNLISSGGMTITAAPTFSTSSCPLLTDFLKLGGQNNPRQVSKLQSFLKSSEKLDVSVTGNFDEKTEAAVMAFQRKYMSEIMTPWGATRPSGFVHITTLKKLNQLACNQPLSLTGDELQTINSFKARGTTGETATVSTGTTNSSMTSGTQTGASSAGTSSVDASSQASSTASSTDTDMNASASTSPSLMNRFGSYFVNLFK